MIAPTLAIAYDHLVLGKVQILDPELDGFHQAQAAAIQEFGDELEGARHSIENPTHSFPGQDGGQPLRPFGANGVDAPFQILFSIVV